MTPEPPLQVRPGARYTCYGDGLCCTDIHGLGPVMAAEKVKLTVVAPGCARTDPRLGHDVLVTDAHGRCTFLSARGGCTIYDAMDGALKPRSCHRFPLGITVTPTARRVTMAYRCSCQSWSADAPPLTVERARSMLLDGSEAEHVVEEVRLDAEPVPFAAYLSAERDLRAAIEGAGASGLDPTLPALDEVTWEALGRGMAAGPVASRFDAALRLFGDALVRLEGGTTEVVVRRPWADSFARAASRPPPDHERLLRDWLLDLVWAMHWTDHATFAQFRRGLGVRVAVAGQIARRLGGPTAWGEAVTIVDLVTSSPWWEAAEARIVA